nr:extracellular solute-binding protein [Clostridia bacterium]
VLATVLGGIASATEILNTASEFPVVTKPITLRLFGIRAAIQGDWEKMVYWTTMEEKTGIHWEFDLVAQDAAAERKSVLLGSGDYPDVFFGASLNEDELINYGTQGVLIPLQDLIAQYMPNLTAFHETYPEYRTLATSADGNIYSLLNVSNVPRDVASGKLWVNVDWLKALNLSVPTTLDEYHDVLKAFKEGDPNGNGQADEIPLAFTKNTINEYRICILPALGIVTSNGNTSLYIDENDRAQYVFTTDAYKEYLAFTKKLYEEGLLDPESFTQTDAQMTAKGNQTLIGSFGRLASYLVDTSDHFSFYQAIPPMTSALNGVQIWNKNTPGNGGVYAVTNLCKYPEAAMRWADYFFSFEGGAFRSQGPEGMGWAYDDGSRTLWSKKVPEGFASSEEYRGTLTPDCGTGNPGYTPREFLLNLNAAHVLDLEANVARAYTPYLKDSYPRAKLSAEAQMEASVLFPDIDKYMKESEARFITGDLSLDKFDEYVGNLKKMGVDRYVELYQQAYEAYKALQ